MIFSTLHCPKVYFIHIHYAVFIYLFLEKELKHTHIITGNLKHPVQEATHLDGTSVYISPTLNLLETQMYALYKH